MKIGPTSTCAPIGPNTTTPTYPARGYLSTGQPLLNFSDSRFQIPNDPVQYPSFPKLPDHGATILVLV